MAKTKLPIYWISGNYYEVQKKWREIRAQYDTARVDVCECSASDSKSMSAKDIILFLKNKNNFESPRRIIKLKGIPEDYARILDYLRFVDEDNVLVVDSPVGYWSKPPAKRFNSIAVSNFYKKFKNDGYVFNYETETKSEDLAVKWVLQIFSDLGKIIDADAAKRLVENKGRNLDLLYSESVKLRDYQTGKTITIKDVEDNCPPLFLNTVWDLINAIDEMKADKAIAHLQSFYDHFDTEAEYKFVGEIQMLLGALHFHFSLLLITKDNCLKEFSQQVIQKAVDGLYKLEKDDDNSNKYKIVLDSEKKPSRLYSDGAVYQAYNNPCFRRAFSWNRGKLYQVMNILGRFRSVSRGATIQELRLLLDLLVLFTCDKLSFTNVDIVVKGIMRDNRRLYAGS